MDAYTNNMPQILIGGEAGQGVAKAAEILGKALVKLGYFVFNYRDYQSLIRGGHNFNVVHFEREPVYSHSWENIDYIVALNKETIDLHAHRLKNGGLILADKSNGGKYNVFEVLRENKLQPIMQNIILIAALWKQLGGPVEVLKSVVSEELHREDAIKAVDLGYNLESSSGKLEAVGPERKFLTGNQCVGMGALDAGIDIYIAYPMTPATPVLHFLAGKTRVFQPENEIAAINAALGASYAGAMTMVGTSGGGFALMAEAMSLQGMSEVPLVVYLAQRPGPSTGIPTYTAQGDLLFAVHVGHGEFPRIVVAPGDAKEAYERTMEAFYLAYKYRLLSIIISDKHLGESHYTFEGFAPRVKPEKFIVEGDENYKSYEITETGVTPRAVPGGKAIVRATSYEHDEWGYTTEDGELSIKMHEKRWRKLKFASEEIFEKLEPISVYGDGDNIIVSWGSTKGAILDALKQLPGWKFVQINYIVPFPRDQFLDEVMDAKRIVVVENSFRGNIATIIAQETGLLIEEKVTKGDGRPFSPEEIVKGVKG